MSETHTRRDFIRSSSLASVGTIGLLSGHSFASQPEAQRASGHASKTWAAPKHPVSISSGNGIPAVTRAVERVSAGDDPVLGVVDGVGIVEADPNDMTVGYGGLPNERGVVQLDSSVMHGPTHKAGSVACIENIMHPAQVALKVLQTTDHVMIVGQGAYEFARAHGFPHEELLTDKARRAWLRWKQTGSNRDDWLDPEQMDWNDDGTERVGSSGEPEPIPFTYGTIHCGAVDTNGNVSACTTTSGLSYKIPGRVGDSPIIGAGMYVDNEIGSAGATGRGEAVIQSCGSFAIVEAMGMGMDPTQACLHVLARIVSNSRRQKRLMRDAERPNFNVVMYALRRDGAYGSAAMFPGARFAVADGDGARLEPCAALFK
jgi:N4-(beta-N-acetylglucosaminyl)-L-asparaginase